MTTEYIEEWLTDNYEQIKNIVIEPDQELKHKKVLQHLSERLLKKFSVKRKLQINAYDQKRNAETDTSHRSN